LPTPRAQNAKRGGPSAGPGREEHPSHARRVRLPVRGVPCGGLKTLNRSISLATCSTISPKLSRRLATPLTRSARHYTLEHERRIRHVNSQTSRIETAVLTKKIKMGTKRRESKIMTHQERTHHLFLTDYPTVPSYVTWDPAPDDHTEQTYRTDIHSWLVKVSA
jgi:hypothetical protein